MLSDQLQRYFGYSSFNPGQEEVVTNIINGQSAIAIFPTGSGKSLCYQLSAVMLPNLTLVVSPLLALISDQLDFLKRKGISAARMDSTLSYNELKEAQAGVKAGTVKILMVSVERFKNERFREFLKTIPISLLVVDEAHCISEWGHNFRPDYLKLPVYKKEFNISQVLLLTATATPPVIEDMCREMEVKPELVTITGFHRPNLHLKVLDTPENEKITALLKVVNSDPQAATIVYVTLQHTAEVVASLLVKNGLVASAYHAGMANEVRDKIQSSFMAGQLPIIVATIAFGMGIDKSDIRRVVHYDLPKSLENYSQEIGRAGRDGGQAECVLLGNLDGVNVLENFVFGDTPSLEAIHKVVTHICKAEKNWEIKLLDLSSNSNIRILPLKTLLVYLETLGAILPLYSYYSDYRFKMVVDEASIINKFTGERRDFVNAIFEHSSKARLWTTVVFDAIITHFPCDRKRITSALEYFHEQGLIVLEAKQMMEVYQVNHAMASQPTLSEDLFNMFIRKEKAEVIRINKMLAFFNGAECLSQQLATYFGEVTPWSNCGSCSVCVV